MLRRPGYSRRPPRGRDASAFPITCSTTRRASRKAVIGEFADSYLNGETPVPCVACNQKIKFHDLLETAEGLGAAALATGHYVKSRPGETGWELHRAARQGARPELFPVRHHAEAARVPALSARRPAARKRRGSSRASSGLRRREVGQPGHLLRAHGALHASDRAPAAQARRSRAISCMWTAACSAAMAASSITRSASGRASAWPRPSRSTWCASMRRGARWWSARGMPCGRAR